MNRVLKQRFNQISRQNNYMVAMRVTAAGPRDAAAPVKPQVTQPAPYPEIRIADIRRG